MTPPPVTPEFIELLRGIAGPEHVAADPESLGAYASDETEDLHFPPDVVVRPGSTAEVSAILRLASSRGIPVTPRGGGTGLSGGALAVHGGICLSLERLNRILEIDRENLQAVVEPGVITQKLHEAVEAVGLFYPPDPASRGSCHLGGNLAEGAGGPRAVKYGVTRDYVLGVEAVLPSGEVITTGARVLKNSTGYNLTHLLIGSEGTLAVITKIVLRLIPQPKHRLVMLVAFASLEDAARAVAAIFQAGLTPSALEFMERAAVQVAEERQGKSFPNNTAGAQLFVEVDGHHEETVSRDLEAVAEVLQGFSPLDMVLADSHQKVEDVWALRRGIGEAVKSISPYKEEDTVVPRARLADLVAGVKQICERHGVRSICYGHAGDGNVHVNLLRMDLTEDAWERASGEAIREIFRLTVSLGGTISGEHGIGYSQRGYLPIALSPATIGLMRSIKQVFDPHGILNPGKIFPPDNREQG
ncbi:MAG: dehydrogenase [Bacteroidetes bacterium]|nr:dehydrogenase [Bacteroidota bacterium]